MGVIFLVGMTGVGKTAVGRRLAETLQCPFLDLDEEIERSASRSISEIFESEGEEIFRSMESRALESIPPKSDRIVALGAGALETPRNISLAHEKGTVIYLRADVETLLSRIESVNATRPLLSRCSGKEDLRRGLLDMLERREPNYLTAQIIIDVDARWSANDVANRIMTELNAA